MTFFPIIELVDRYSIAKLKSDKTNGINFIEFDFYTDQLKSYDLTLVTDEMDMLYKIHAAIWNLESELKSSMEAQLELAEIGRRAIEIRNFNNKRIQLKNAIAEKLGCSVREIKAQHISE